MDVYTLNEIKVYHKYKNSNFPNPLCKVLIIPPTVKTRGTMLTHFLEKQIMNLSNMY